MIIKLSSINKKFFSSVRFFTTEFCYRVEYEPSLIGNHSFKIKCKIDKLRKPVSTIISARVFEILPKVIYLDPEGQMIDILKKCDNIIDLGQVI